MSNILAFLKELVVPSTCYQLRLRVLLFTENVTIAILVNVEAVLRDRGQLDVKSIIIDRFTACYINMQGFHVSAREIAFRQGT